MNWLNKLERKFGKYYIRNLMAIITAGSAVSFILSYVFGSEFLSLFTLDPGMILQGQIWRLVTFIFVTPAGTGLDILYVFTIYLYYIAGSSLENVWGGFKFNVYYLLGVICAIVVAFINLLLLKNGIGFTFVNFAKYASNIFFVSTLMNLSIFLAYAKIYPDLEILIFFVLPVKMKYLRYIIWGVIVASCIKSLINHDMGGALFSLVPVFSYLLFFAKSNYRETKMRTSSVIRMKDYKKKVNAAKKSYIHKCEICGITNLSDPDMEFRYCSKCNGKHCYCAKHILDHNHIE